jgi:Protein of unknown function (DUF2839)
MGDAKRRKDKLGEKYGQEAYIFPWLPITKTQSEDFIKWTTRGTWAGIGLLIVGWVVARFIGPSLGWWTIQG